MMSTNELSCKLFYTTFCVYIEFLAWAVVYAGSTLLGAGARKLCGLAFVAENNECSTLTIVEQYI